MNLEAQARQNARREQLERARAEAAAQEELAAQLMQRVTSLEEGVRAFHEEKEGHKLRANMLQVRLDVATGRLNFWIKVALASLAGQIASWLWWWLR